MNIKPIRTEDDYQAALADIDRLMDAEPDTPEGDRLDVLATLVEAWEEKHVPIEEPDPIEAIRHRMEALGMNRKELEALIGGRSRVSEVLNRKRPLSLTMIRRLSETLRIPAGAQSGSGLRVRGEGVPGDPPGDLELTVRVVLPKADTPRAKELFESMARELPFDPRG